MLYHEGMTKAPVGHVRPHLDGIRACAPSAARVPASGAAAETRRKTVPGRLRPAAVVLFGVLAAAGFLGVRSQVLATMGHEQGGASSHAGHLLRQPAAVTNGLVAWYPMDGSGKDASGNGNDGTLNNVPTSVQGKFGKAYSFNGINQSITTSGTGTNQVDNWSMSAWVNPAAFTGNDGQTIFYNGTDNYGGYGLEIGRGNGLCPSNASLCGLFGGVAWIPSGYVFPVANAWYHVVMERSSGTTSFWVNGVQTSGTSTYTPNAIRLNETTIGVQCNAFCSNSPGRYLNGLVDDARIYNRALSASEITQLYGGSKPVGCDQYCVGWWKFDEGSGTTAKDSTSNGNTGTLNNFNFDGTTNGWTGGVFGNALQFNGTNNYASTATQYNNPNPFTISLWFKSVTSGPIMGFSQVQTASGSENRDRALWLNGSGTLAFTSGGSIITSAKPYLDGAWHHAVATLSNAGMALFVDGGRVAANANTGAQNYAGYWRIGEWDCVSFYNACSTMYFKGSVDDVRIYGRALQNYEVYDQYAAGRS